MPTPSSSRTTSDQQPQSQRQLQPLSPSLSSQQSCPEDHLHPPSYAQVEQESFSGTMNVDDDALDSATSSPSSPQTATAAYRYVLDRDSPPSPPRIPPLSSPEMPSDASNLRSPSYAPMSPTGGLAFGQSFGSSRSVSRSTTVSPRPHSRGNSTRSTSGESNAATSPTPDDDDDCKTMDIETSEAGPSQPRRTTWLDPDLIDDVGDFAHEYGSYDDLLMETDWTNFSCHSPAVTHDFSSARVVPSSPSSYLRPGSRFKGTQTSERSVYKVDVEIKHVDFAESFLCGYLHIEGLTADNPSICTYFEGEIIGPKYGFLTKHKSWGADEVTDLSHWNKFGAFRPYSRGLRKGIIKEVDFSQKENIFMRWKEHFLVPDHRKSSIPGASFEGFYYICFNQVKGEVAGIYFHHKSEKFQQLELRHIPNAWRFGALEFR